MNKNDINWENFAKDLLWRMIVSHKNEDSGYDVITSIANPEYGRHGYNVGDIGAWRFLSFYIGDFKPLTWKELALELGIFADRLTPDGHDCKICPEHKKCQAYFKDDPDHERCNFWGMLTAGTKCKTTDGFVYDENGEKV